MKETTMGGLRVLIEVDKDKSENAGSQVMKASVIGFEDAFFHFTASLIEEGKHYETFGKILRREIKKLIIKETMKELDGLPGGAFDERILTYFKSYL